MYGSSFWIATFSPRDLKRRPSEAVVMPLPRPEATPPVTKMNFGCAFTTGCEPSRRSRHAAGVRVGNVLAAACFSRRETSERVEPAERRHRVDHARQRDGLGDGVDRDGDRRADTTTPQPGRTRYRPRPIVKPSRLAPPSPSMARSRRSKPRASDGRRRTTPGRVGSIAEVDADARRPSRGGRTSSPGRAGRRARSTRWRRRPPAPRPPAGSTRTAGLQRDRRPPRPPRSRAP